MASSLQSVWASRQIVVATVNGLDLARAFYWAARTGAMIGSVDQCCDSADLREAAWLREPIAGLYTGPA